MLMRLIGTFFVAVVTTWLEIILNASSTLIKGQTAGMQFDNSNQSYLLFKNIDSVINYGWLSVLVAIIALLIMISIWFKYIKNIIQSMSIIAILLIIIHPNKVFAFAETTDRTEIVTVLPNESAFWIPDVGANRDSQVQFDSESYLQANKIAVKRFEIPHQKLLGSGGKNWIGNGWDIYIPTGRMIIVPRQPYSQEWVDSSERGSSSKKEGFPCQDNQGLDFTVGVSIATSVSEDQAAKFLYNFGVTTDPKWKNDDPQIIFKSVYYARSLYDVMEDVGRKRVQTLMCDQIMQHDIDYDNANLVPIMNIVRKQASDFFNSVGINLVFLGYADTVTFDPSVQASINRKYIATQDRKAADLLGPYIATIQALAQAEAVRSFGQKSDGKLPSTVVGVPPSFLEMLNGFHIAPTK